MIFIGQAASARLCSYLVLVRPSKKKKTCRMFLEQHRRLYRFCVRSFLAVSQDDMSDAVLAQRADRESATFWLTTVAI